MKRWAIVLTILFMVPYSFVRLEAEQQNTKPNWDTPTNIQNKSEVVIFETNGEGKGSCIEWN